jgi:hypothetical protein
LLDPKSGLHWWSFQFTRKSDDHLEEIQPPFVVYFTDHEAVGFTFAFTLTVREVPGHHANLEALERAVLADLGGRARALLLGGDLPYFLEIPVRRQVGELLFPRDTAAMPPPPQVVGVHRDGNTWRITLKGPNQAFAEVTLDSRYAVKSVRRVPGQ